MFTPQEVSEKVFPKTSFGGYHMGQVDEFLDQLTADYTALFKENAALKNKMKVLVEKVEEYRSTEDAMRKTLLSAQQMASTMVEEAESRKETLLQEAQAQAQERIANLREEYDHEQFRLDTVRQKTAEMVAKLREVIERESAYLDELASVTAPAPHIDLVEAAAREIERHIAQEDLGDTTEIPAEPTDEAEYGDPVPIRFDDSFEPEEIEEAPQAESFDEFEDATAPTRRLEDDEVDALLEKLRNGAPISSEEFYVEEPQQGKRIDFDNLEFGENYKL